MRIAVDESRCQGHGRCYTLAPDLLHPDDEGFVTLRGSSAAVPPEFEDSARAAMNACPEDAITLEP